MLRRDCDADRTVISLLHCKERSMVQELLKSELQEQEPAAIIFRWGLREYEQQALQTWECLSNSA
jgi:hypothetical protein